jgi:diguanylate cyclase (GGDEF)-like protein/PAS domain S-box-containing protein
MAAVAAVVGLAAAVALHGHRAGVFAVIALALLTSTGLGATVVCGLRARTTQDGDRAAWVLLSASAALEVAGCWFTSLTSDPSLAASTPGPVLHVITVGAALIALQRLRAPTMDRAARRRGLLDGTTMLVAVAIVTGNAVFAPGRAAYLSLSDSGIAFSVAASDVVLAVMALLTLSRARYPGGVNLRTLLPLSAGLASLAAGDAGVTGLWLAGGAPHSAPASLFIVGGLLLVAAAGLGPGGADHAAAMQRRERIAVSAAVGPVVLAALAVAVYEMTEHSMPTPVIVGVVLLSGLLLARLIVASLDNLVLSRTLESQVAERTLELVTREQWFRSLVQHSSDVVTVIDPTGVVRYQSPAAERLFGNDPAAMVGLLLSTLVRPADVARLHVAIERAVAMPGASFLLEFAMAHRDGSWRDTETVITSLVDVPDVRGLVLNTRDVSDRKQLQERLTHQAYHDGLTGLANRSLFQQQLATALTDEFVGEVAVLFCDLDGFKAVNDSQGHDVGDTLLRLVAERLRRAVRAGDIVARFGGDEFAVLVQDADAKKAASEVAERIAASLQSPFALGDREVRVGVSIGIAMAELDDYSVDALLRNADLAMYRAKADRHGTVVVFEREMHDALLARLAVEDDLRGALGSGELVLHYQPTVALSTGVAVGVEALMRWYRPDHGIVGPQEFIGIAEDNGFIDAMGQWALFEACRQGASWQSYARPGTVFSVGVNISARQVTPGLVDVVAGALAESGLSPAALLLEMTESVLLGRTEEAVEVLHALKRLGVRIAIDDFGTGFSSLSYLSRFPVDVLKIDKGFICDVDRPGEPAELARTIVQLGRSLRLATIAEGIETQGQRHALLEMGCDFGQGYLFSRPLPANGVTVLLQSSLADIPAPRTPKLELAAGA